MPDSTTVSMHRAGIIAPPPVIYALAFLIGIGLHWRVPLVLFSPIDTVVGGPVVGGGALLMVWAFSAMRRARTPVSPYRPASAVVVDGPYRWSRNPIYLGLTLSYTGAALLAAFRLTFHTWYIPQSSPAHTEVTRGHTACGRPALPRPTTSVALAKFDAKPERDVTQEAKKNT